MRNSLQFCYHLKIHACINFWIPLKGKIYFNLKKIHACIHHLFPYSSIKWFLPLSNVFFLIYAYGESIKFHFLSFIFIHASKIQKGLEICIMKVANKHSYICYFNNFTILDIQKRRKVLSFFSNLAFIHKKNYLVFVVDRVTVSLHKSDFYGNFLHFHFHFFNLERN